MITKYGYDVVLVVLLVVAVGSWLSWNYVEVRFLRYGLVGALLVFLVFTLAFFRDPDRNTPHGDGLIIAPADGKVVLIADANEQEYMNATAIQVSIFMSPLNVHVNRFPIGGKVGYYRYVPGEFMVAFDDKSSLHNERTHIGVENARGRVFFKQIAGFVARRIVANLQVGDQAVAGQRFGMIKFGSRVDVFIPKNSRINVKLGDITKAGETVLAEML